MNDNLPDRIRREQSDSQIRAIRRLHEADHIHLTDNHFTISDAAIRRHHSRLADFCVLIGTIVLAAAIGYALVNEIFLL